MGFLHEFKRAASGDETRRYALAGAPVRCVHCGGEDFESGTALLNTAGMTFLKLDWANREAALLTCVNCGEIRWFLSEPQRL